MGGAELEQATAASTAVPGTRVYGDAYVTHFTLVLRTIVHERRDLRALYSPRELRLAESFLTTLAPSAQNVYARLFQRKGPWFKTASLLTYFTRRGLGRPIGDAEDALDAVTETVDLTADGGDDVDDVGAHDRAQDCSENNNNHTQEETERSKAKAQAASAASSMPTEPPDHATVQGTVQALVNAGLLVTLPLLSPALLSAAEQEAQLQLALEAIRQCASAAELAVLWKKLSGGKKVNGGRGGASASPNASNGSSTATTTTTTTPKAEMFLALKRLVSSQRRIDGSRIPVARLMHRVWLDDYPLARDGGHADDVIVVVRLSTVARELFTRMHRLFYFQSASPLASMPVFVSAAQRTRSFAEILGARLVPSANGSEPSSSTQWPGLLVLFKKVKYPSYAITIEHPIFSSAEMYLCYEMASKLHRVMNTVELEMAIEQVDPSGEEATAALGPEWQAPRNDDPFEQLPLVSAFQRVLFMQLDGDGDTDSNSDDDEWQATAWTQFSEVFGAMDTLDAFILESLRCFRAYTHFHQRQDERRATPLPVFYVKCNAGYHLARVLHIASAIYEKQRRYRQANALLEALLGSVFLQRKRGHWWERLATNLEHLKVPVPALRACEAGLRDDEVRGAGRITLARRYERLARKHGTAEIEHKPSVPAPATTKEHDDEDDDDFVIDLVSSDDEDKSKTPTAIPTQENRVEEQVTATVSSCEQDEDALSEATTKETALTLAPPPYEYPRDAILGRPLNKSLGEKSRFIGYDDEPCNVEQLVLQFYHSQADGDADGGGWYGVHCEGRVLGNLFGLFMWDVLYAAVPDVFQTAYQLGPLDFGFAEAFYQARAAPIHRLLERLEHEMTIAEAVAFVRDQWLRHHGEITRFVSWGSSDGTNGLPLRFHELVVLALGTTRLARLLRHMTTSPEYHRAQNGLPDLLLLRIRPVAGAPQGLLNDTTTTLPIDREHQVVDIYALCEMAYSMNLNDRLPMVVDASTKSEESSDANGDASPPAAAAAAASLVDLLPTSEWQVELKLVEVKGPRDRLSDQQHWWLELLNEQIGVDARVMHVLEEEKKERPKKQPNSTTSSSPARNGKRRAATASPSTTPSKRTRAKRKRASNA